MKKIAIVYDRANTFGGAEQVLCALKEAFPSAVLYTSVYDPKKAFWAKDWEVHTSALNKIPFLSKHHEWFGWLMPYLFESFDFSGYDIVLTITSEAAKAVLTRPSTLHICYCLTPTRYLWSHTHMYEGSTFAFLLRAVFSVLRLTDYLIAQRPDKYVAISTLVSQRILKYYRRKTDTIILPPITLPAHVDLTKKREYFLVVSRLVAYKNISQVIAVCMKHSWPLVIVGSGRDAARLKKIARDCSYVSFVDFVSDDERDAYYEKAIALVCPQIEDFGIVSLEAQSHGTPVITAKKSGMAQTILDGSTGILYQEDLVSSMQKAKTIAWDREGIYAHAAQFSKEKFIVEWKKFVAGCSVE